MLRRNRPVTFSEIRPSDISWAKFLPASSCHSAFGARCADLICWTHFCSSHISTAPAKRRCAWTTLLLLHEVFSVDPLLLIPLAGQSTGFRTRLFSLCGPSFPHSSSRRDPRWCRFFAIDARPARSHHFFLRWTHFYSFRLIGEEPSLHAFDFHGQVHWATRYWNSGSTAKGRIGVSAGSASIAIRSARRLPRNRDPSDRWRTCSGSKPIRRAQVASAATGSSASTIFPSSRGVPCSGPLPSIALMPSAITK